jgi:phospholipid/cholesterol/gamma-HCH transport system substrate-binding protein
MLVMMRKDNDPRERARLLVAGVVYLATVVGLISLSIAVYNKAFTTVTTVTLEADRAGLQLAKHGDVRYSGVLVGQIREVSQSGDQAKIVLALQPDAAKTLPRDIEADIMPTTLFGRKFVALVPADEDGPVGLEDGTVVPPERVHTSVELSKVLSRLFPLLRAVRPGDLSATLGALATALAGRGEAIGASLDRLDDYLTDFNVHLPTLRADLRLLASVAEVYRVSADDLVAMLANLTVTSETLTDKESELGPFFGDVREVAVTGARILEDNEVATVRALELSVPFLEVLDKYSQEYDCLLRGIAAYKPVLAKTFEGGRVKQFIEFPTTQVRGYDQRDIPEYADKRGPRCWGLPDNPPVPWPGLDLRNGTNLDSEEGRGDSYYPGGANPSPAARANLAELFGELDISDTGHSSVGERRATTAQLSTRTGISPDAIPALSTLLYGPMLREES